MTSELLLEKQVKIDTLETILDNLTAAKIASVSLVNSGIYTEIANIHKKILAELVYLRESIRLNKD